MLVEEQVVKFRCERDTLADAVSTAQRAVASRTGALPVLSGLRLTVSRDGVEVVGSDLELTIRVRATAQVDTDGVAVLPARLFADLLHKLEPGSVSLEVKDDDAIIECGRFRTTLRTLPAADFPRIAEHDEAGVRVAAPELAEALRQVVPAASKDDARPILT
ncbi:MAG: DNA polymerase III subunit beta, partial [Actinobacteria bacterium]